MTARFRQSELPLFLASSLPSPLPYPAGYITSLTLAIRTDEDAGSGDILSHKIMAVGTFSGGVLMEDF